MIIGLLCFLCVKREVYVDGVETILKFSHRDCTRARTYSTPVKMPKEGRFNEQQQLDAGGE